MFDIEIDPTDAEHAMFTTGFGGWETFNLSAVEREEPVKWSIMSAGIEETVPLELYAPEKGARLISGIGDYGGFTHFDLNRPDSSFRKYDWSDRRLAEAGFGSQGWYTVWPSAGCKDYLIFRRWGQALDYVCHRSNREVS